MIGVDSEGRSDPIRVDRCNRHKKQASSEGERSFHQTSSLKKIARRTRLVMMHGESVQEGGVLGSREVRLVGYVTPAASHRMGLNRTR